jgi:hypothetical protein
MRFKKRSSAFEDGIFYPLDCDFFTVVTKIITRWDLQTLQVTLTLPCWVEFSLSYDRRSVNHFVSLSGSPSGPMTRLYAYPFFSDNYFVVLPVGRPLWRENVSVTYSAIADSLRTNNHTLPSHLRLRFLFVISYNTQGCGWDILTRLHTGL